MGMRKKLFYYLASLLNNLRYSFLRKEHNTFYHCHITNIIRIHKLIRMLWMMLSANGHHTDAAKEGHPAPHRHMGRFPIGIPPAEAVTGQNALLPAAGSFLSAEGSCQRPVRFAVKTPSRTRMIPKVYREPMTAYGYAGKNMEVSITYIGSFALQDM